MTKAVDFELRYPPEYVPDKNMTVYRVPLGVPEGTIPNAEDDGCSVYVSDELTREEAIQKALHGQGHDADNDWSKPDVQQIELEQHGIRKGIQVESLDKVAQRQKEKEKARLKWERLKKRIERSRRKRDTELEELGIHDPDQWVFDRLEQKRLEPPYK